MQITQIDGISGSNITTQPAWGDAYDLAAEREAQAEALLADLTPRRIGRPSATPLRCAEAAVAAIDPAGKVIRTHRNSRKKAVDRWRELCYLLQVATDTNASDDARASAWARMGRINRWNQNTAKDRIRRAQRRQRRAKLLAELNRVRSPWVEFGQALTLCEMGARTLFRATMEKRIRKATADGRIVVSTADLRQYLKVKVKIAA